MEDEAVPVLFLERFDEASVHGDALVEGKIGNRFDHVHAVVDILLGEEWVYVAYEELKIDETIAIRHDDGQLVCVGGRFLSAAALQRQILELGLDLWKVETRRANLESFDYIVTIKKRNDHENCRILIQE